MTEAGRLRAGASLHIAVALMACAVLALEISLTRILSVLLRFHFVFLVISSAMCGLGIGGMLGHYIQPLLRRRMAPATYLAVVALGVSISIPVCLLVLFRTGLVQHVFQPLTVPAAMFPPFLLAGVFLASAFDLALEGSGQLYFADLLGAGTGALGVVVLLNALGGMNATLAVAVLPAAAAAVLWWGGSLRAAAVSGVVAIACAALVVANRGEAVVGLSTVRFAADNPAAAQTVKPLFSPGELGNTELGSRIVATDWNAFARTDVVANEGDTTLYVYTDGDVPTNMLAYDGTVESVPEVAATTGFVGMVAGPRDRVLFIGPGGGLDVHLGLEAGAREMVGVELNPSIPRLMHQFRERNGSIYATEGVSLFVDEGRSFVRRRAERFDVIYTALTKTATTATSGLALMESYVFTVEGFRDYLDHLTPGGRLVVVLDQESLSRRAMLTAVRALRESGVSADEAPRHCALLCAPRAQRTLALLGEIADAHGLPGRDLRDALSGPATDAGVWWASPYSQLLIVTKQAMDESSARRLAAVARRPWLDLALYRELAAREDPFLGSVMPVLVQNTRGDGLTSDEVRRIIECRAEEMRGLEVLYLPSLKETYEGLQMVAQGEVGLDDYVASRDKLNLAPVTDDRPFFLDLAKGSNPVLLRLLVIPAGAVAVALLILGIAVLLSARAGRGPALVEHATSFGYFALLGVGFMLVEVPLAQKLVLFLGYPTLTLSVVVFGLLVGGSLGSLWSQSRATDSLSSSVRAAGLVVAAAGFAHAWAVPWGLGHLLGIPVFWRSLVALGLVVPLGMALGVPFPAGLRLSGRVLPNLTPALWGVNGVLSTAGTVLAMFLGREAGFVRTILVGCACYLAVVLLVPHLGIRRASPDSQADAAPLTGAGTHEEGPSASPGPSGTPPAPPAGQP